MIDDLHKSIQRLQRLNFPADLFVDLPTQAQQPTAALFYEAIRARLAEPSRQGLEAVEAEYAQRWGAQTASFFAALSDTFSVLAALDTRAGKLL